ncbi:uncharacterized protein K441DRAFT_666614 [Cenococcum geophilum 1.58]|uniref:uncharacterized protein n=1 Tax=Cenococcum geophilum 1.58 TaxID=794803 RepID=UPI00358EB232|nr:hypothetical protein K441DRAFT_666614 [Cenococcum geophilum 1.58]
MSETGRTVDVTDEVAEDNQKLKGIFKDKTKQDGEVEGDWTGPHKLTVRGPFQRTTAVVIKHGSSGYVTVFKVYTETDHRPVATYNASDGTTMIILESTEYCWVMNSAKVKYIS